LPARSKSQLRWINSPSGRKALGAAGVQEWDQASKGLKLPEKVTPLRRAARGNYIRQTAR